MAVHATRVGCVAILTSALVTRQPLTLVLHLYSNNAALDEDTTVADLQECVIPGYSPITLVPSLWRVIEGPTTGSEAFYPWQSFTFLSGGLIYGMFVTDETRRILYWADAFAVPTLIQDAGGDLSVAPFFGLGECICPPPGPVPCHCPTSFEFYVNAGDVGLVHDLSNGSQCLTHVLSSACVWECYPFSIPGVGDGFWWTLQIESDGSALVSFIHQTGSGPEVLGEYSGTVDCSTTSYFPLTADTSGIYTIPPYVLVTPNACPTDAFLLTQDDGYLLQEDDALFLLE